MNPLASSFLQLVTIMDELREQCPWDKKQTIDTLRSMTIEETYELADAITSKDWNGIREELGDVLLHILFYARIGKVGPRIVVALAWVYYHEHFTLLAYKCLRVI